MGISRGKKYVCISGFNINQDNRGNAALSYGTIHFLMEKGWLKPGQELVLFQYYRNPFKAKHLFKTTEKHIVDGIEWTLHIVPVTGIEKWLLLKFNFLIPFTNYRRIIKQVDYEAADYGGDGFSDIYGDRLYYGRMNQTIPFMKVGIPLIILPQTIGPFAKPENEAFAHRVLKYASRIFVRDDRYTDKLKALGLEYEKDKDLSAYMLPEPWDIDVPQGAIGINVSGLAYSNNYGRLVGQFDSYPSLIDSLISHFRDKGHTVYLIPHSYNYAKTAVNNDDMEACRLAYDRLQDKSNVVLVDKELTSPRTKYVISRMDFFIGTRMHANFAAIYTGVPVFGLAYSYKFQGAFDANGLDGERQTTMINHLKESDIPAVIAKIDQFYSETAKQS